MRALISVYDKTGIVELAETLVDLKYEIISSGGTYSKLKSAGIPVKEVSEITQFPEMLDGRVKTLHPAIHGGLLALRENREHMETLSKHNIQPIDIVVVNLYPFEATIRKKDVPMEEVIENIDIGGPSMVRSAAKNHESVGVIVNPERYKAIITELKQNKGQLTHETKRALAVEAFEHTFKYDELIAGYLRGNLLNTQTEILPPVLHISLEKIIDCRYGENPHQKAAFYKQSGELGGLPSYDQLNGKELSFNNLYDLQAAWAIVREFNIPAAVIVKHTNPCGAALGNTLLEAYTKAYAGDPQSAFGGIVGLNRHVDAETATHIAETFIEAVIAPSYDTDALEILRKKKNLRILALTDFFPTIPQLDFKKVDGGLLVQEADQATTSAADLQTITTTQPDQHQINDLMFAWTIVKHVKSNAIVLAKNQQLIGPGAGQMSRVDAVDIALRKAGNNAKDSVLASDAFFPFADSIERAHLAGIRAIIQPGGSVRDQETIDACNKYGIAMVFTGLRHFKH